MKISIVLPFLNHTGGIQVAVEHARQLHLRGHEVTLYAPLVPYRFGDRLVSFTGARRWIGDLRLNVTRRTCVPWAESCGAVPIHLIPWIDRPWMPAADIVMATAWPTAYSVARLPASSGAKVFLIQHHETWSGPAEAVDGSYRLPVHRVVSATWLHRLITVRFGLPVLATITNGVDSEMFSPVAACRPVDAPPRVLMQYHSLPWKGLADGFAAWHVVRQRFPQARLVLFGLEPGPDIPAEAEFHRAPTREALRDLYRGSDIFVSTSWAEGCQLPPMEAMACRCAVVATNVGGIPDYAIAGQTALVVEPRDVDALAQAIVFLLQDTAARRRLAAAGHRHIQQFTWDRATLRLEAALQQAVAT